MIWDLLPIYPMLSYQTMPDLNGPASRLNMHVRHASPKKIKRMVHAVADVSGVISIAVI